MLSGGSAPILRNSIAMRRHLAWLPPVPSTAAVLDGTWMTLVGVAMSRWSKASDDPVAMVAMGSEALALAATAAAF